MNKSTPITARDKNGVVRTLIISEWAVHNGKNQATIRYHRKKGVFTPEQIVGTEDTPKRDYSIICGKPDYSEDFEQCNFNNRFLLGAL